MSTMWFAAIKFVLKHLVWSGPPVSSKRKEMTMPAKKKAAKKAPAKKTTKKTK
jgi:hypothetical protein